MSYSFFKLFSKKHRREGFQTSPHYNDYATIEMLGRGGTDFNYIGYMTEFAYEWEDIIPLLEWGEVCDWLGPFDPTEMDEASLHWMASAVDHENMRRALESRSANVNVRDTEYASTPLHKICGEAGFNRENVLGVIEVINVLISFGADIESRDIFNLTPLAEAVGMPTSPDIDPIDPCAPPRVIEFLLKEGADPLAKVGYDQNTVLDFCERTAQEGTRDENLKYLTDCINLLKNAINEKNGEKGE